MATGISNENPLTVTDYWLQHAIDTIYTQFGDTVSVEQKDKDLLKFGRSNQVSNATYTTLMTLPSGTLNETYVASNLITHVSSSQSDTGSMVVEGHTISGGNLTFVSQTVTLAGTTKTALGTPLARCTRIYNDTGTNWTGNVYAYEDVSVTAGVPQTDAAVHCMIPAGFQQSFKGSTSVSSVDYWIITQAEASILTKASAFAEVIIEARVVGKVFTPRTTMLANGATVNFKPYIVIKKNSDVRMVALADTAGRDVSGFINGILAVVV